MAEVDASGSLLARLRSIEAHCTAISPSESHIGTRYSHEIQGLTELSWNHQQLLWCRGCQLVRSFTFSEKVVDAMWAWLGPDMGAEQLRAETRSQKSRSHKPKANIAVELSSSQPLDSSGAVRPTGRDTLTANSHSATHHARKKDTTLPRRALVVFLQASIWLFYPDTGETYNMAKTFRMARAFPAQHGVLFQRGFEPEDHQLNQMSTLGGLAEFDRQLPTLFYLGNHLGEIIPVRSLVTSSEPQTSTFVDIRESVVLVTGDQRQALRQLSLVITVRPQDGQTNIYSYTYSHSRPGASAASNVSTGAAQPQEVSRPSEASRGAPSGSDLSSKSVGKGRPSLGLRRSSRLSSQYKGSKGDTSGIRDSSVTSGRSGRRRSSRFHSAADVASMSRIDESFIPMRESGLPAATKSANSAAHTAAAVAPTESERYGDAVEAEEMGQMVEGLANQSGYPKSDRMAGRGSLADDASQDARSASAARPRRVSQPPRTPFQAASTRTSSHASRTGTRGRHSRGPSETHLDATSFHSGNLTTMPLLTPTLDDKQQQQFRWEQAADSGTQKSEASVLEGGVELRLIERVHTLSWSSPNQASAFLIPQGSTSSQSPYARLYIQLPGTLLCRTLHRESAGAELRISAATSFSALSACAVTSRSAHSSTSLAILHSNGVDVSLFPNGDVEGPALSLRVQLHSDKASLALCHNASPPGVKLIDLRECLIDDNCVTISLASGQEVVCDLPITTPTDPIVHRVIDAVGLCGEDGERLLAKWISQRQRKASDWAALESSVLRLDDTHAEHLTPKLPDPLDLLPQLPSSTQRPCDPVHIANVVEQVAPLILRVLNAVAQDLVLDCKTDPQDLRRVVRLVGQISSSIKCTKVFDYWSALLPSVFTGTQRPQSRESNAHDFDPAAVMDDMLRSPASGTQQVISGMTSEQVRRAMPLTKTLRETLQQKTILHSATSSSTRDEESALHAASVAAGLVRNELDEGALESVPQALALWIRSILRECAENPPQNLPRESYRLMRRQDLAVARSEDMAAYYPWEALRSMPTGSHLDALSAMLFAKDYRLSDVVEMLQTHKVTVLRAPSSSDRSEEDAREAGMALLHNVAERIKATAVGRGMLSMLTKPFDPTQRWFTPRLNRRILLRPPQPYHHSEPRPDSAEMDWPEFHNGAASALEMIVGDIKVDSIWYFSQSLGERNARHAGLLLGLGLAGRFETIGQVHTYRYLGDRHNLTSIGLLLGLSVTFAGRGDPDVRALLACHVKAFLPPHSANLAHSTLVQAAALLGTGLLFLGSDVNHIAEALCDQIGAQEIETTDTQMYSRGAYALSAGFGAGLVMLGRAKRGGAPTAREKKLLLKLEHYIAGSIPAMFEEETRDLVWRVDGRITAPVAAVAYALFYLKSNDAKACSKISLPSNSIELDQIKPETLLVFSIARNLIMWDAIRPTPEWVDNVVPAFLNKSRSASLNDELARVNTVTGAYFAMALKFAGSGNKEAKATLLAHHAQVEARCKKTNKQSYDLRIFYTALRSSADLAAVSLSIVLAGSGDVDVLRLLRLAHARTPSSEPYGSHMAIHMAMGMLFLAGGRCTLGNSDAAVAALLISFWPRFPTRSSDNRAHLQAYRHLWTMAVEPRLVVAQDVDTGEIAYVPTRMLSDAGETLGEEEEETTKMTPFQLPSLERVQSIKLSSPRYFDRQWALGKASAPLRPVFQAYTLHVKRKAGYLSYAADPSGYKSEHRLALREQARWRSELSPSQKAAETSLGSEDITKPTTEENIIPDDALRTVSAVLAQGLTASPLKLRDVLAMVARTTHECREPANYDAQTKRLLAYAHQRLLQEARQELQKVEVQAAIKAYLAQGQDLPSACANVHSSMNILSNVLAILAPVLSQTQLCQLRQLMRKTLGEIGGEKDITARDAVTHLAQTAAASVNGGQRVDEEILVLLLAD